MDDEDLVMEEHDVEEEEEDEDDDEMLEEQRRSPSSFGQARSDRGKNTVYPEEFMASSSSSFGHHMSPRFGNRRDHHDFSRFDMMGSGSSPIHGWNDAIDEKGESVALMMHLEKSIVHQKFFNSKCRLTRTRQN